MSRVSPEKNFPQGLIVAPTRELAIQIRDSLAPVARSANLVIEALCGGMPMEDQIRKLKKGVHIVVGTPGRLNDHLKRRTLDIKNLKTLVLDEADIMLDMGFREEIDEIFEYAPKNEKFGCFLQR